MSVQLNNYSLIISLPYIAKCTAVCQVKSVCVKWSLLYTVHCQIAESIKNRVCQHVTIASVYSSPCSFTFSVLQDQKQSIEVVWPISLPRYEHNYAYCSLPFTKIQTQIIVVDPWTRIFDSRMLWAEPSRSSLAIREINWGILMLVGQAWMQGGGH